MLFFDRKKNFRYHNDQMYKWSPITDPDNE